MSAIKKLIHPNTLNYYSLGDTTEMQSVAPIELLNSNRLDVMARYLYARSTVTGDGQEWGAHCYHELIRAWSQDFKLPPPYEPGRSSMQDYWDQFNALIKSIQNDGFDISTSVIPTCDNTLVDGAHRLAASLACDVKAIYTVPLEGEKQVQNYETLKRIRMDQDVLLNLVYEFVKLKPNTRIGVTFPVAHNVAKDAKKAFEAHGLVDYHEQLSINFNGLRNLQHIFYGQHDWWNAWHAENFAKLRSHKSQMEINIFFFQETNNAETRKLKEKIRTLHEADTHVMHTTDTHEETLLAAELLLNNNGRNFLNNSQQKETPLFDKYFKAFSTLAHTQNYANDVALDTGSVLALHGLRDITDIDYILSKKEIKTEDPLISAHHTEYDRLDMKAEDIIYNPKKHLTYKHIKFVSLDLVKQLKTKRAATKDKHDLILIEEMSRKSIYNLSILIPRAIGKIKYKTIMSLYGFHDATSRHLKALLPPSIFNKIREIYRFIKKLGR